jgi:predicted Rossmann-fold nucleotide-binding protein
MTIIGIVGGTSGMVESTLELASATGRCVAENGGVLLTGGKADKSEKSVKAKAMCAAVEVGKNRRVGVIGILPGGAEPKIWIETIGKARVLYLESGVSSDERNALTGGIPDALLVLGGGKGTLSEVAYALNARKPIVFLKSWETLQAALATEREKVKTTIDKLGDPMYPANDLMKNLTLLLENSSAPIHFEVENSPLAAVQRALTLGRTYYPKFEKSKLGAFRDEFETKLKELRKPPDD